LHRRRRLDVAILRAEMSRPGQLNRAIASQSLLVAPSPGTLTQLPND
jgi:hypothetical protein